MDKKDNKEVEKLIKKATNKKFTQAIDNMQDTLIKQTYGVSRDLLDQITSKNDVDIEKYKKFFFSNNNDLGVKSLSKMKVSTKDIKLNNKSIEERMENIKENMKAFALDYSGRVLSQADNLYLVSNMPQLYSAIEMEVDEIFSPNKYDKDSFIFEIAGDDNSVSHKDIKAVREKKDLDAFIKETIIQTYVHGYQFVHVVPYNVVANRILDTYGNNNKNKKKKSGNSGFKLLSESVQSKSQLKTILAEMVDSLDYENETSYLMTESIGSEEDRKKSHTHIIESPLTESAKSAIQFELGRRVDNMTLTESLSAKELTGCHIEILDNTKVVPIIVNRDLIGVYYIERSLSTNVVNLNRGYDNLLGYSQFKTSNTYGENPLMRRMVIDEISAAIKGNLNEKFIKDNKHIISTIERVLDEKALLDGNDIIRFIPREYLVPYQMNIDSTGLGRSQLTYARVPAHYWILLDQNDMMNELYHKKDKVVVKYNQAISTEIGNSVQGVIDQVLSCIPNPSDILNLTQTHVSMGDISTFIAPRTPQGVDAVSFEKIEGQDTEKDPDLKDKLEHVATFLTGIPISLTDINTSVDFATQFTAANIRVATKVKGRQTIFNAFNSELYTKVLRCEKNDNTVEIKVAFPEPKILNETAQSEATDRNDSLIEKLLSVYAPDDVENPDSNLKAYLRKSLYEKFNNNSVDIAFINELINKYNKEVKEDKDDTEDTIEETF